MRSILRNMAVLAAALMLAGCVIGSGGKPGPKGANPITGGEIEVTALDAPAAKPGQAAPAAPAGKPALPGEAPPVGGKSVKPGEVVAGGEAVKPGEATAPPANPRPAGAAPKEEIAAPEAAAPVPHEEKSAARLACEKRGDMWVKAGKSSVQSCVKRTRDAGKSCTTGKGCQGECLARSGTCAPYQPLFGCNEVLQDNGVRTMLCLD